MPSLGGDQYKWYCEIPPLAEPGNYPGGVKTKPPFEMGVDDFEIRRCKRDGRCRLYRLARYSLIIERNEDKMRVHIHIMRGLNGGDFHEGQRRSGIGNPGSLQKRCD